MAEPIMFTKNYINADDSFTVFSGASSWANAYNRDPDSLWQSSGAGTDGTGVQIDITFYEGSTAINRTIDRLILLNHNLKNFTIYYWDGSTYQTWLAVTGESRTSAVYELDSRTVAKARIISTDTQTVNQEKAIGEAILCAELLDIGTDMQSYDVQYREKSKTLMMGDGSMQRILVYWSPHRTGKYEAKVKFNMISKAVRDALIAIKEAGLPFLWYPESEADVVRLFYVHWSNTLKWKYSSQYKDAGFDMDMDLKEV